MFPIFSNNFQWLGSLHIQPNAMQDAVFLIILIGSLSGLLLIATPLLAWRFRRWRDQRRVIPSRNLQGSLVVVREYPCYVLPVMKLLELTSFLPHQQMIADGMLVQATPDMTDRIVFVSSEWCVFQPLPLRLSAAGGR